MNNKQFAILICAVVLSAIILSLGITLQNGIYEYKNFQSFERGSMGIDTFVFIKFNKLTGNARTMAATSNTGYHFIDTAEKVEQKAKKDALKSILPE